MGDWPSLGKNASNAPGVAGDQAQAESANKSEVTTGSKGTSDKPSAPKTSPQPAAGASPQKQPPQPSTDAKPDATTQQVGPAGNSGAAEQPSAAQPKASQQTSPSSAPQNTSTNSVQSTTSNSSQNGPTANGYPAQGNNGNRRVPKSKWVPLDIELPSKVRGKPRERNNNISSSAVPPSERPKRREIESDADHYSSERDPRNTRRYRSTSSRSGTEPIKPRHSTGPPPAGGTSTRAPYPNSSSSSAPRPSRGPSNVLSSTHPKRTGPIRSVGGIQKSRPRPVQSHHQNGEFPSDYAVDYTSIKKIVSSGLESGQPFLMPYLGTYYYNGVPSYANMDTTSLKEAIRKQM